MLAVAGALAAQTDTATLGAQNLRPYWHVFTAYALAWVLVVGWLVSVARRLARLERSLGS
jgi:CcmD family protein